MKRRAFQTTDSLELLLDAVTNAFGGILFLAILVVLLVNRSTQPEPDVSEEQKAASAIHREQIKTLQTQADVLIEAIHAQEQSLRELTQETNAQRYASVLELQHQLSSLELQSRDDSSRNQDLLENANKVQTKEDTLRRQILDNENQKATLEEELARLRLPQIRTARTPRLRRTMKQEFPMILRYGRLYVPYLLDADSGARSFNREQFILLGDELDLTRVTPKPYRGIPIQDEESLGPVVKDALQGLDKDTFYVAIAAWSDSFLEFNALRNTIVEQGYEYRIVPVEPGGFIQEGSIDQALIQ